MFDIFLNFRTEVNQALDDLDADGKERCLYLLRSESSNEVCIFRTIDEVVQRMLSGVFRRGLSDCLCQELPRRIKHLLKGKGSSGVRKIGLRDDLCIFYVAGKEVFIYDPELLGAGGQTDTRCIINKFYNFNELKILLSSSSNTKI